MQKETEINNMTNEELVNLISDMESKYGKLLKVAKKLADEMDSLHSQYTSAKSELAKRKNIENGK